MEAKGIEPNEINVSKRLLIGCVAYRVVLSQRIGIGDQRR
jgi:hypothetical protein